MTAHRAGHHRWAMVTLVGAVALAAPTVTAGEAAAHDVLVSTSPAAGSTVARVPGRVVLTFDSPALQPGTAVVVTGPDGPVQQGPPVLVDTTVAQPLRPGAPAGAYRVAWRATSVDGHPVSGRFGFTARAASAGHPGPAQGAGAGTVPGQIPARSRGDQHGIPALAVLGVAVAALVAFVVLRLTRSRARSPS